MDLPAVLAGRSHPKAFVMVIGHLSQSRAKGAFNSGLLSMPCDAQGSLKCPMISPPRPTGFSCGPATRRLGAVARQHSFLRFLRVP